ncbi:hypothetical protein CAPTEDRAFT_192850 [Capitella teleta]|uniref:Uncharacterized protein n=1 Tax=Capitella teleta TaxID=283909 RepID=R7VFD2_CAPTE|nr:hypothetical protein CAPTEDRAFT_192850 [Capitella teleta]|eukprot:ELU17272.1 hypothetical protein CAPTEDRAFT_192850 [Capitella teleta]
MASASPSVVTRSCSVRCRRSTPLPQRRSLSLLQPQMASVSCDIDLPQSQSSFASLPPPPTISGAARIQLTLVQPPAPVSCDLNSSQPQSSSLGRCALSLPRLPTSSSRDLSNIPAAAGQLAISSTPTPRRPRLGLSSFRTSTPMNLTESCLAPSSDLSVTLPSARRPVPRTTPRHLTPKDADLPLPVESMEDRVGTWLQITPDQPDVIHRVKRERRRASRFCLSLCCCCSQQSTEMPSSAASMEDIARKSKKEGKDKKREEDKDKTSKKKWRSHIKRIKNNLLNFHRIRVEFWANL